jgi:methylenetetrahydrofolate reductase (NADPH)
MLEEGLEPILQLTTRDRNVLALQSDLLGAWALGVRATLALSGDPLKVGPYESIARPVSELDSLGLARLISELNQGRLAAGEELQAPTDFLVAGAANPLVDTVDRLEQKLAAGVGLLQTNIVYDVSRFADWFAPIVEAGIPERAPVIVGVTPPRSTRMLRHMHDNIPGIEVDEATFARLEGLEGEDAKTAGIDVAVDVVGRLREIPGVAGVHLMAPGWEAEAVPRVAERAGLVGSR